MNFYEMYDLYEKTADHKIFDIETFNSFVKLFDKRLKKIPVIYKMFQQYTASERKKFIFDLKVNGIGISELNYIVDSEYDPGLYRKFFLHPFFDFNDPKEFRGYGMKCMRMKKNVFGWERLIADSEYAMLYNLDKKEYAWVDVRWILTNAFISRTEMKSDIMWFGAKYGDKLKVMLKNKFDNSDFFKEVLNWIENERKIKTVLENFEKEVTQQQKDDLKEEIDALLNVDSKILCNQELIDITAARDFWCAFLIEQSKVKRLYEEFEKAKNRRWRKSDIDLLSPKQTMEEAYKTVWGKMNAKDFAMRKQYMQHVMELTNMKKEVRDVACRQPVWWLSGDNLSEKKSAVIELQRDVYRDDASIKFYK